MAPAAIKIFFPRKVLKKMFGGFFDLFAHLNVQTSTLRKNRLIIIIMFLFIVRKHTQDWDKKPLLQFQQQMLKFSNKFWRF
jgi:hypothetical protein